MVCQVRFFRGGSIVSMACDAGMPTLQAILFSTAASPGDRISNRCRDSRLRSVCSTQGKTIHPVSQEDVCDPLFYFFA